MNEIWPPALASSLTPKKKKKKANESSAVALNEVLTSFHGVSGLRANRSKSHPYFSSSVTPASKEGILHTLGMETFGGLLSLSHSVVQAQGESKRPGTRGGLLHFFILFYTNERKDALAVTPLVRSRSHPWSQARKTPAAKQRLSPRDSSAGEVSYSWKV